MAIEEKLDKLGVERGSGSNVPHIHAPHARAASVRRSTRVQHVSLGLLLMGHSWLDIISCRSTTFTFQAE
jgi:hypothetical protein